MTDRSEQKSPAGPSVRPSAVEWLAKRDRGLTEDESRRFAQWLSADPANRAEYARAESTWRTMDQLGEDAVFCAEAELVFERALRRRRRKWLTVSVAALGAAASLAVVLFMERPSPREEMNSSLAAAPLPISSFNSLDGSARVEELPDGTVVELNGDSVIEIGFTPERREVRLVRGEAHFTVEKNPDRPFVVTNRTVAIRAVGTAFNVRIDGPLVDVIVTEGVVSLEERTDLRERGAEARAAAGTRAVIELQPDDRAAGWRLSEPSQADIDQFLAWRSPRLTFSATPLDEVIAAFNRHNKHQLRLADPRLESRTLTGSFRANNLPGFIRLLQSTLAVETERVSDDETVLRAAAP